jgi:hypothetical protein
MGLFSDSELRSVIGAAPEIPKTAQVMTKNNYFA